MRRLLLAATLAATWPAHATTIGLHTASWHDRPGYHGSTPGLYLRAANGMTAGALQNSEGHLSCYAGWTATTDEQRPISAAVTVGVITGYELGPVLPIAVPSVALRVSSGLSVRLLALPRYHPKQGANALSLTVEWRPE